MALENRFSVEGEGEDDSEEGEGYGDGEDGERNADVNSPLLSASSARDDREDWRLGTGDREDEEEDAERGFVFAVDILDVGPNGGEGERV